MLQLRHPASRAVFIVLAVLLGAFVFFPIVWMLLTAFKPQPELFQRIPTILPETPTLENFGRAITRGGIPRYVLNSLITAGGSALCTTVIATYAAYSLAKYSYRGRRPIMYLLISARMFPLALILISLYPIFSCLGLLNTHIALILAYVVFALPAASYFLYSYFAQLPSEIIEAARVDGAGDLRILHMIIVPLAFPALITVALYGFIWGWNDLLFSLTLVTSDSMRTIGPGLLFTYLGEFQNDWGGAMAASIVTSVPIILAFTLPQRFFVQGLTAGAVKS